MKRDFRLYLDDIIKYIEKAEKYTNNLTYEDFLEDDKTSNAVIRCIEVLGEASNKIPDEIKSKYPIPWRDITNMRNRIIHGYFDVDIEEVWIAAKEDMKELKPLVQKIITDYQLNNSQQAPEDEASLPKT
ncbi:MAG: HepT-like ribonuclease domain-containing protein [bacterium]